MPLSPQQKKLLEEKLEQAKKLVQSKPLEQKLVVAKRTFNAVKEANTKLSTFKTFDELAHDHEQKIKDFLRKKEKEFEAMLAQYRKDIQEYQNKTGSIINNTIDKIQDFDILLASHKQTLQERQQEADQIIRNTLERVGSITQPKDGKTPEKKELLALIQPLVDEKAEAMRKILSLDTLENRIEQIENRNKEFRFGGGGGGGVHYFYELRDTPNRAGKLVPPYKGSEGKFIKVSADGKTLEFAAGSGGSGDVSTDTIWDAKGDLAAGTGANTAVRLPVGPDGTVLTADSSQATGMKWAAIVGTGDVVGPASATDNAIVRFETTTGKLIQNSTVLIDDSGNVTGIGTLNTHTIPAGTGTLALTSDLAGYANNSLSNLASVAVNTSLISDTDSTDDLGSASIAWANLYVDTVRSATGNPLDITPTAGQNLNINLTTTGDFVVNTNQLYVDTSLGNVGIGTTNPSQKLDVAGNINIAEGSYYMYGGQNALRLAKNGESIFYSTLLGQSAGNPSSALSTKQTAVGYAAGNQNTGAYQTVVGYSAGYQNTGERQTAIGYATGAFNTAIYQTAVGYYAGRENTGAYQTALGHYAGTSNTGNFQTVLGHTAGNSNTGASQTALGYGAGFQNTGASQTVVGHGAGNSNTGLNQIAVGYNAGRENTGNQVTGLGYEATKGNSGNDVVAIGYQAGKDNTTANQFIVKQANINNIPLIQGDFSTGSIGIGTTAPSAKLEVLGAPSENPYIKVSHHLGFAGHAGILIRSAGSGGREYSITSGYNGYAKGSGLHFEQSDGLLVTMKSVGNVGIGTSGPGSRLSVSGGASIGSSYAGTAAPTNGAIIQGNVGVGTSTPQYRLDINGEFSFRERSSDPADPPEGSAVIWMSNGNGTGDDGDILMKITAGSITKTITLVDYSAI